MPGHPEIFAQALLDAAAGKKTTIFKSYVSAEAYLLQMHVILHDDGDIYPHGCASEILTRLQAMTGSQATLKDIADCQTLEELNNVLSQ